MLIEAEVSPCTVESIRGLLQSLYTRIPLKLWMVTTVRGDVWKIIYAHDNGYDVAEGGELSWRESLCCRMMQGDGPQFATCVEDCAAYVDAPIRAQMPIKAYIGVPLLDDHNHLIGTLCGIDPEPEVVGIRSGEALVRQTAALVSRLLVMEMQIAAQRSLALKWSDAAHRDGLTGLLNRRGWDGVINDTASHPTREIQGIIIIDLNDLKTVNDSQGHGAGDELIQRTADALTVSMRGQDVVARLGGDEFGILLSCDSVAMVDVVLARIEKELVAAGVSASTGFATVPPADSLAEAFVVADEMMFLRKRAARK